MRISDWSSDVCSSDLALSALDAAWNETSSSAASTLAVRMGWLTISSRARAPVEPRRRRMRVSHAPGSAAIAALPAARSEEHTSELQSLMRISYAVFCLKKKKKAYTHRIN